MGGRREFFSLAAIDMESICMIPFCSVPPPFWAHPLFCWHWGCENCLFFLRCYHVTMYHVSVISYSTLKQFVIEPMFFVLLNEKIITLLTVWLVTQVELEVVASNKPPSS